MVKENNHTPVVAKCTVELPARYQTINPIRTKDKSSKSGQFEPTKPPGGVLLSKTVVEEDTNGSLWVRAVNLTTYPVTLYKNQRAGIIPEFSELSEPFHLTSGENGQTSTISNVKTPCSGSATSMTSEIGVELRNNELSSCQSQQLEKLILPYSDIFSTNKRDLVQHIW